MDPGSLDLDTTPLVAPPPGHHSNFTNPESRSYQLVIIISVLSAFVALLVPLRLYTRLKITRSFGADDWLCFIATALTLSYSGLILHLLWKPGGGILRIHLWDLPLSHYAKFLRGSLADSVLFRIASAAIKVAWFLFYLRLFYPVRYVRYMAWVGIAAVVTFCVVFVVIEFVACAPWPSEHGDWLAPSLTDRCGRISPDLITAAVALNVVLDFYILFIPLHQIPKLHLSNRRKIGFALLFLTGLFAACAALANLIIRLNKNIYQKSDFTWTIVPVYATGIVELNVGLLCHSIPVVFVLFVGRFRNLGKSLSSWVRDVRSPRHSSPNLSDEGSNSSANLAPGDDSEPPHVSVSPTGTSFSRVRKFMNSVARSGVRSMGAKDTSAKSFDEMASADLEYNRQLRIMVAEETKNSHTGSHV